MQDLREHILNEAGKLLAGIGPSSMTMDMIARKCGISKRTLYETFPDKRSLIMECVELDRQRHQAEFKTIFEQADNCFQALFHSYLKVRAYLKDTSTAFLEDIKRMYPEIHSEHKRTEQQLVVQLADVIVKAQHEGHVLPDINPRIAAFLFLNSMNNIHHSDAIEQYGFDRVEVFDGAFLNFLRGIATNEGISYIDTQAHNVLNNHTRNKNTAQ